MHNQQRILGVHYYQVLHPHHRHKFLGAEDVVVVRLDRHVPAGIGHVALGVAAQPRLKLVLVERSPRAQIVPTELGGNAIQVGEMLALG